MAVIQDAKGRVIPSWARYVVPIEAAGSLAGIKEGGNTGIYIPFGLYLTAESEVVFTTVDDPETEVTFIFGAGYHPIEFVTITSTSTDALALYASKPVS